MIRGDEKTDEKIHRLPSKWREQGTRNIAKLYLHGKLKPDNIRNGVDSRTIN